MTARGFEHVTATGTRQVCVVEHDRARIGLELFVECAGELTQRSSALVAIRSGVAARHVLEGESTLPGPRDAHDDDDLRTVETARRLDRGRTKLAEGACECAPLSVVETQG